MNEPSRAGLRRGEQCINSATWRARGELRRALQILCIEKQIQIQIQTIICGTWTDWEKCNAQVAGDCQMKLIITNAIVVVLVATANAFVVAVVGVNCCLLLYLADTFYKQSRARSRILQNVRATQSNGNCNI